MNFSILKNRLSSPWLALVLIALVAVIIYSNTCQAPFVFDDVWQIVENVRIRDLTNYLSLEQILKPRTIVDLAFAVNYKFGKFNVFGYHLANVIIHIINGFLVYFLALTIFKQLSASLISKSPPFIASLSRGGQAPIPQSLNPRPSSLHSAEAGRSQSSIIPDKSGFPLHSNNHQPSIPLMSLFAALIFIAHPIQTQAVTYTIQRYASMAAMFYMASVLFYLKARVRQQRSEGGSRRADIGGQRSEVRGQKSEVREHRAWRREQSTKSLQPSVLYIFSILCGMLAVLSKLNTASLPGAILLVEYLLIDQTWQGWKKKILWFVLAFTLWGLFILYVVGFFTGGFEGRGLLEDVSKFAGETTEVSRWHYLCTQFNVLVIYIRLIFLPVGQNLDYLYPFKSGFFDSYTPLAFLFLAGIAALGIWNLKKRTIIALAIFWFFITLSVESSIIPIRDALFEHRLYLPMLGFSLLIAFLSFHFLSDKRSWAIAVSVVIMVSLGTATYLRNRVWQSELSLWSDVVSKNKENFRAWSDVGLALFNIGKPVEAVQEYEKAIAIQPNYAAAWYNFGNALLDIGKPAEAVQKYEKAIAIRPDYAKAWYNLGNALLDIGKPAEAIQKYEKAIAIQPEYAAAWNNWGYALIKMNQPDRAIEKFQKTISLRSDYARAWGNLGTVFLIKGKIKQAIELLEKAVGIDKEYTDAWRNWGIALVKQGKLGAAVLRFRKAANLDPDDAEVWSKWGSALVKMGKPLEAIPKFEKAVTIEPEHVEALSHWGVALGMMGRLMEAVSKFEMAANIKPGYIDAWINWGNALVRMERFEEAVEKYEKALFLNPEMPNVRRKLLEIKKILGMKKAAYQ